MSKYLEKEEAKAMARDILWMTNNRSSDSLYVRVRYDNEFFYVAQDRMACIKDAIKKKTRRWYNVFEYHNDLYYLNPIWVRIHQKTEMFYGGDAFSTPWQQLCCDTVIEPTYSCDIPANATRMTADEFMALLKEL